VRSVIRPLLVALLAFAPGTMGTAQTDPASPLDARQISRAQVRDQIKALPETPGQLFGDLPSPAAERPQTTEPRVKRARAVAVNADYVTSMLATAPLQLDNDGLVAGDAHQQVLNLFDDLDVRLVKLNQSRDTLGNIVWTGGTIDDPMGSALIVIDDGQITANIVAGGRTITVMPGADGVHTVREMKPRSSKELLDPSARPKNDAIKPPRPPSDNMDPPRAVNPERERAQATTTLRVYFVYTAKALIRVPNMASAASLAIAHINTTFTNSQITAQAELVGLDQVTYTEGSGSDADDNLLNDASNQVGDFERIHKLRAAAQADLIAVIGDYGTSSCGLGWINDDLDQFPNSVSSYVRYGVSLTNATCLPSTFTHEVGHNLGAHHDRFAVEDDVPGPTGYNYGYVDTTAKFMDVMAYNDECESLNITCTEIMYYSNPNLTYNGRPIGIADNLPAAANNSRKVTAVAPLAGQFRTHLSTATPTLSVLVSGSGTVTSSPTGISCGTTCGFTFTSGASVVLTATATRGSQFTGWSGACSGTGTCTVAMSSAKNVTATFVPALRLGAVYSSAQPDSQSFLRFANTGSSAGTVSVVLANYTTGATLGTWTSASIAANAALQVPITTVETALAAGTAKPAYYSASIQSQMTGYIQHVLYRPADGTLTNLSTCETGVTTSATQVSSVHSSILDNGYPSTVAVTNVGASSGTATLGIFDANNGTRLGTYTTASIPRDGQLQIAVATIQTAIGVTPTSSQYHYVIKLEGSFRGSLQHLVNNTRAGVITDMTTQCAFGTVSDPPSTAAIRQPGPVFSSAQSTSQSFLRFYNTGTTAGTVNVTLANSTSGTQLASWTSPSIPPNASAQYQITTPETALTPGTAKPTYYSTLLQSQITGYFQHVLYRPGDGTLTNLSTCETGVMAEAGQLINVHTSLLDAGYPSSVVVNNTTAAAITATLAIYDATNGVRLGAYTTASIPANGQVIVPISTIQTAIGITPTSVQYHYVIKTEGTFNGFLQHLVNNQTVGVITDMTTMCKLPTATAVRYNTCFPTSCNITVGAATTGQLKKTSYYENFRVSLTAGQSYTIDVKGSSTSNGTLVRPYVYIYDTTGTVAEDGGGGGTGTDARLTFTPTTTGNHTIQVTAYVYTNNGGTFQITVN